MALESRGVRTVFLFLVKIQAKLEMLPANRELHVVTEVTLFLKVLDV
jgi:hypothetical protein